MALNFIDSNHPDFGKVPRQRLAYRCLEVTVDGTGGTVKVNAVPNDCTTYFENAAGNVVPVVIGTTTFNVSGGRQVLRFWLGWRPTGAFNSLITPDKVKVLLDSTEITIVLKGKVVSVGTFNLKMVLDRSVTMGSPAGNTKLSRMLVAARTGANLLSASDTLEVLSFSDNITSHFGPALKSTLGAQIDALPGLIATASGSGSQIGNVLAQADAGLGAANDRKSILLMTDGNATHNNTVAPLNRTFVVGIDVPPTIPIGSVAGVASKTEWSLGTSATGGHETMEIQKLVSNLLADATSNAILVDPDGLLREPGESHDYQFEVSAAESDLSVIVLTPFPGELALELIPPGADVRQANNAFDVDFGGKDRPKGGELIYRLSVEDQILKLRPGRWTAKVRRIVHADNQQPNPPEKQGAGQEHYTMSDSQRGKQLERYVPPSGVPYSLQVHGTSTMTLESFVHGCPEQGSELRVVANLSDGGFPVRGAVVTAEVVDPNGNCFDVTLQEADRPGRYLGKFGADASGPYKVRFLASGILLDESRFQRESLKTPVVLPARCR